MSRESCSLTAVARGQPALFRPQLTKTKLETVQLLCSPEMALAGASGEGMGYSLNGTTDSTAGQRALGKGLGCMGSSPFREANSVCKPVCLLLMY